MPFPNHPASSVQHLVSSTQPPGTLTLGGTKLGSHLTTTRFMLSLRHFWIFGFAIFFSCENPDSSAPVSTSQFVQDDAGRQVSFAETPKRVIPLAPNMTELLFAAGADSSIVAVSNADDFPPSIEALPKYSSFPMDFEALVSFKPDVLLATEEINSPRDADQFTSLGLPILYYSFKTIDDIPRVIKTLGALLGTQDSADEAAGVFVDAIEHVKLQTANTTKTNTLFLIGADQLYAFGKDHYIHEAIAIAGGTSATASLESVSPILSEEFVLTTAPDVIIGTFKSKEQLLEHHPAFASVPAIANDRICIVDASPLLRPGPRLADGIIQMAQCLHPTLF